MEKGIADFFEHFDVFIPIPGTCRFGTNKYKFALCNHSKLDRLFKARHITCIGRGSIIVQRLGSMDHAAYWKKYVRSNRV